MGRRRGVLNLSPADILLIQERAAAGDSYRKIARELGIDPTTASRHGRRRVGARDTHGNPLALTVEVEAST